MSDLKEEFQSEIQSEVQEEPQEKVQEELNLTQAEPPFNAEKLGEIFDEMKNIHSIGSTGFKDLDDILNGGFYPGVYTLAAEPGAGKTTLALQISDNLAKQDNIVLYFSQEMSKAQIISKSISRIASSLSAIAISANDIWEYEKHPENFDDKKGKAIEKGIAVYSDDYAPSIATVEGHVTTDTIAHAMEFLNHNTGRAPFVVIDYLQILKQRDAGTYLQDNQHHKMNVETITELSLQYNTPILLISSLNRSDREKKAFTSLAGTAMIEYDSSVVMFIKADEEETGLNKFKGKQIIDVQKNRYGVSGEVKVTFNPEKNLFFDDSYTEVPIIEPKEEPSLWYQMTQ